MLINPQDFLLKQIPQYHPKSKDYFYFWKEEARKVVDGAWLGGYYMPPSLYFYVNFSTIQISERYATRKKFARPWLREIEWEYFRLWTAAQGFSGFEDDLTYSCDKAIIDTDADLELLRFKKPNIFKPNGELKEYVDPMEYLRKRHDTHFKSPLYNNEASNIMMLGSRDSGKSFAVGTGMVLHQWLTDGMQSTLTPKDPELPPNVDITVGAEGADKSTLILNKIKLALDFIPGSQIASGRHYPSPLSKRYSGSFSLGSQIVAGHKTKVDGGWVKTGTHSTIKHRSFKNNPFADQGSRPTAIVLEECGLFSNLKEVYYNTKDNLRNGMRKTSSLIMMGTGGDMESGTLDAADMFYNPEAFEIYPFQDIYEMKGKIGYFIPAYMVLTDYLDDNKMVMKELAMKQIDKERSKAKAHSSDKLAKELQYRPIKPSEMFISKSQMIFPVPELRRRLSELETDKTYVSNRLITELYFDPNSEFNGVNYALNTDLRPIDDFPLKDDTNREGAVVIYELPQTKNGAVQAGHYIIGCDPFKDDSTTGQSLASIYVMKTNKYPHMGHSEIVASYVGRPFMGKNAVNETLYKLSLFYGNAKIYFENAVGNVKDYFERIKRLDLLALQPVTVFNKKASYNTNQPIIYGYPMSNDKVKWEAIQYVRQFLLEDRQGGDNPIRNLDLVPDVGLLKELINFNMDGNFDRVMSLVGCVIGLEETNNLNKRQLEYSDSRSQLDKDIERLFINNTNLFKRNEGLSQTTLVVQRQGF